MRLKLYIVVALCERGWGLSRADAPFLTQEAVPMRDWYREGMRPWSEEGERERERGREGPAGSTRSAGGASGAGREGGDDLESSWIVADREALQRGGCKS